MLRRTIVLAIVVTLVATAAVAQVQPEEQEQAALRPCLIADGRTYVPVAFVEGIPGLEAQEPVVLDGVPMIPVAPAVKAAAGSARITCEVVCPDEVKLSAVVADALVREWCKQHCKFKTYRCWGPCGPASCKMMTCPCMPMVECLLKPCSKQECPYRGRCRRVLVIQAGGQEMSFEALTAGSFWKQPEVRDLLSVAIRQPIPRWPHVDTTFPKRPPFGVNWKRPYLDWKPDESWLQAHMQPAAEVEPTVRAPEPAEAAEEQPAEAAEPAAAAAPPAAEPAEAGAPAGFITTPPPEEGPT